MGREESVNPDGTGAVGGYLAQSGTCSFNDREWSTYGQGIFPFFRPPRSSITIISSSLISTRQSINCSLSSVERESAVKMADLSSATEMDEATSMTVGGVRTTPPPGVVGRFALDMEPG